MVNLSSGTLAESQLTVIMQQEEVAKSAMYIVTTHETDK